MTLDCIAMLVKSVGVMASGVNALLSRSKLQPSMTMTCCDQLFDRFKPIRFSG
jgi:hypothetical protein